MYFVLKFLLPVLQDKNYCITFSHIVQHFFIKKKEIITFRRYFCYVREIITLLFIITID